MTTAPRTWVVGETVTAAMLNQEIRDQLNSFFGAWTAYTPAWTATTTAPVLGNGTISGLYMKVGRTCHVQIQLTAGSSTTFGAGTYGFGVPFISANTGQTALGVSRLTGLDTWIGQIILGSNANSTNVTFPATSTNTRGGNMSPTSPENLANGALLRAALSYQTAS